MSKVYVAFLPNGSRVASGSMTSLREKTRQYPDTTWAVYLYDIKGSVESMVMLVEGDVSKWPAPKPIEHWKISAQGQVRKFDPTKVPV